jgi:hypothetical protein
LAEVVHSISDSSGDKGATPIDIGGLYAVAVGELYAAAWCGFLKYSILGDASKARREYDLIWTAHRDQQLVAAPKALTAAWLKNDPKSFVKQQQKDFERLWARSRKHAWSVKSETEEEIVITANGYDVGHMWCWSHIGLALLAHRKGWEVATDPFFFPASALKR